MQHQSFFQNQLMVLFFFSSIRNAYDPYQETDVRIKKKMPNSETYIKQLPFMVFDSGSKTLGTVEIISEIDLLRVFSRICFN